MRRCYHSLVFILFSYTLCSCDTIQTPAPPALECKPAHCVKIPATPKIVHTYPERASNYTPPGPILTGAEAVMMANKQGVVEPNSSFIHNGMIIFPYTEGSLYQIYTTPLSVTDLQFSSKENIISVAAGDTLRWQISKTVSGSELAPTEHILVKPLEENISTTMVITTTKYSYHLLLKSTDNAFMSSVRWQHGSDTSNAQNPITKTHTRPTIPPINYAELDTQYVATLIHGNSPDWFPRAVFNDGYKTYIKFPYKMQSAPALFVKPNGSGEVAANYRVYGNYYVIDQVITQAELSSVNRQTIVKIMHK